MTTTRQSRNGIKLVKSDTFWPEGQWYFIQDLAAPLVWSPKDGWKKYYEVNKADSHFKTEEEAMAAWRQWNSTNGDSDSNCEG